MGVSFISFAKDSPFSTMMSANWIALNILSPVVLESKKIMCPGCSPKSCILWLAFLLEHNDFQLLFGNYVIHLLQLRYRILNWYVLSYFMRESNEFLSSTLRNWFIYRKLTIILNSIIFNHSHKPIPTIDNIDSQINSIRPYLKIYAVWIGYN